MTKVSDAQSRCEEVNGRCKCRLERKAKFPGPEVCTEFFPPQPLMMPLNLGATLEDIFQQLRKTSSRRRT